MSRKLVASCLTVMFLMLLSAPTIIGIVDDSFDISIFFDLSEEEEKIGKTNKNTELLFLEFNDGVFDFALSEAENNLEYFFRNYPKPHLNLISPPPELQTS